MTARKETPAESPQHTTAEYKGKTVPGLQARDSLNKDTNSPCQTHILSTSEMYSSTSSSDGGIQLPTSGHADLPANSILTLASPAVPGATNGNSAPSSATYFDTSPASGTLSVTPLRQSLDPRYSPPNSSAVSSSLDSPVTSASSRPRHPQSYSTGNPIDHTTSEDAGKLYTEDSDYFQDSWSDSLGNAEGDEGSHSGNIEGRFSYDDGNDGTEWSSPVKDDTEDVMNAPIDRVAGLTIPRIDGITSLNAEVLNDLIDARLDGAHPARRTSSLTGHTMSPPVTPGLTRDTAHPHVQFATNTSVQETPFAKTLKYFKQFKGKGNTPSKSRRSALLPEEIAELAKDAQQEGIEEENELWERYRALDLAPLDPVVDGQTAGDLITSTPTRKTLASGGGEFVGIDGPRLISIVPEKGRITWGNKTNDQMSASVSLKEKVIEGHANETGLTYLVDIPGHFDDAFKLQFRSRASVELIASFLRERGEALDASKDDIDCLVEEFLKCPSNFTTGRSSETESLYTDSDSGVNLEHDKRILGREDRPYPEDPVFVKALGMVPEAMFWAIAQPVANCSNKLLGATSKAFDTALHKLTGLSLDEPFTSE